MANVGEQTLHIS